MKVPRTEQNWLSRVDIRNLMKLAGFEALETHWIVLLPKYVPLLSAFLNRFCARLPFFKRLCMTQVVVARTLPPLSTKRRIWAHCWLESAAMLGSSRSLNRPAVSSVRSWSISKGMRAWISERGYSADDVFSDTTPGAAKRACLELWLAEQGEELKDRPIEGQ